MDISPDHRHSQVSPVATYHLPLSQVVFGVGQNIGNMNRAALESDPPSDRPAPGTDRVLEHEIPKFCGEPVVGRGAEDLAIKPEDGSEVSVAEACCVLNKG